MRAGRFLATAAAVAALLFGTAQAQRQLSQDVADVLAVEPAHTIQIPVNQYMYGYAVPFGPASTEFYRIPRDLFMSLAAHTLKTQEAFEAVRARGTLVRSFVSSESDADSGARVADVGEYPVGQYAAVITNSSHVILTPVTVTTIGVLSGNTGDTSAFWAVNLADFSAHRERVRFFALTDGYRHTVLSNADGLSVTTLKRSANGSGNSTVLAQASDGSIGVLNRYWYDGPRGETAFVQTDRPLYREGQHVYFRAIYRTGDIGSFAPAHGKRRIRILDEDNTKIYDHTLTLDRFGAVRGDFTLADSARLGAYRILVDGNDWGPYGFQVQAYKKPEYEAALSASRRTVVGGHSASFTLLAKYFFGRPAAGMHVTYTAVAQPQYFWFSPFDRWFPRNYESKTLARGAAVTDDNGAWTLRVPTTHLDNSQTLEVTADLRDASGRTVSTNAAMQIVPATFSIGITQDQWFVQIGRPVSFGFEARSYEADKPELRTLHVTIARETWNRKSHRYDTQRTVLARDVKSGEKASVAFTPDEAGMYALRVTGTDDAGDVASAASSLWVSDPRGEPFPDMQQPLVTFSKTSYKPGERLRALISLPVRDRDVLAVLTTDRVVDARVVHVGGYSTTLSFNEPADAQHVTLSVSLPQEIGVLGGSAGTNVTPAPRALNVAVAPDKAKYEPGQRAEFRIHVTDVNGKPVRTQIGISVVDAALLALLPDSSNIGDTFYGPTAAFYPEAGWYRPNRALKTIAAIRSNSAQNLVKPGTTADTYAVPAPQAMAAATPPPNSIGAVRSKFADTAYWVGDAQTDANGDGRIVFRWPDNLTTWVAKAVAVDVGASFGQGNGKALVTKDFLVRLELPRFLRKGDKTTIGGIAHGLAGTAQAHLRLDVNADPLDALIAFDHTASASTFWPYTAPAIGEQTFVLHGSDGTRSDAMQLTIPIESAGTAEHERDAGITQTQSTIAISLPAGYDAGALHVQLTPSVAAQLVENVRLLDVYPYYCTEQTMSAALPAVFVDQVLRRTHLQRTEDQNTPAIVKHALARLAELQHSDGSWGWWENDDGHPFMTAYALYGLTEFRKAGYDVSRDNMYARGIDALVSLLDAQHTDTLRFWGGAQRGSEWNTRAYMLFSLADAAPERVPQSLLRQTIDRAKDLNSYALATLGLAVHALGDDTTARRLLVMLNARAIDNGTYRYWTGESWHYAWEDDPIETTAYALRLNAALGEGTGAARIVAFLRSEQHGSWWFTTKDTAAAIYAIAQTVPDMSAEFSPDETVRVSVDGRVVRSVHVTQPILEASDADLTIPAASIRPGSTVAIERTGTGALYWSSDFTRYAPPWVHVTSDTSRSIFARLFPKQPPLSVTRTYDTGHKGAWRVGDEVKVTVTVRADEDVQYVAIEDPFPAGVEYQPLQGQTGQDWSGVQFFDDRAVFFADTVYKRWPVTLHYSLRVTTPGAYTAPGPNAYAMYGPPVAAQGDAVTVAVQP